MAAPPQLSCVPDEVAGRCRVLEGASQDKQIVRRGWPAFLSRHLPSAILVADRAVGRARFRTRFNERRRGCSSCRR